RGKHCSASFRILLTLFPNVRAASHIHPHRTWRQLSRRGLLAGLQHAPRSTNINAKSHAAVSHSLWLRHPFSFFSPSQFYRGLDVLLLTVLPFSNRVSFNRQDKMQFSFVMLLAIAATVVSGAPAAKKAPKENTCDLEKCVSDLAPTVAECVSAAAFRGTDPISDGECLTAASSVAKKLPAPCTGCTAKLGISDDLDSAKNAIEGLF
ncbi:hypothetical protein B0H14DRAFT_1164448, partial [Mycena olivaceomarginata]